MEEFGNLKRISVREILYLYEKGERRFERIKPLDVDFSGHKLEGASFVGSDLTLCKFDDCDLTNANFSNCNLDWSAFRRAILRGTNFENASIKYADLSGAVMDSSTNFRNADLSQSLAIDTEIMGTKLEGAITTGLVTSITQLDPNELDEVINRLVAMNAPTDIIMKIKSNLKKLHQLRETLQEIKADYFKGVVEGGGKSGVYGGVTAQELEYQIGALASEINSLYGQAVRYAGKKESKDVTSLYR